ncbi:MAG: helix-turn-helix domain-containing protein [Oscillospiraceae bacterium]|nr:helix-turn-helix domain-containing protein [Oscillospiraceae bacterium]
MKFTYTNLDELPLTLTATEAAAVLRISRSKVYELTHTASFPAIRIGNRVVIPRDKLIEWMNAQAEGCE